MERNFPFRTANWFFLSVMMLGFCEAAFAQAPPALPELQK